MPSSRARSNSTQDELIELGHNWYVPSLSSSPAPFSLHPHPIVQEKTLRAKRDGNAPTLDVPNSSSPLLFSRFIHNPNHRSVRVRYEAIGPDHPSLPAAELALTKIAHSLLQISGCRATIVPCLHRDALRAGKTTGVVLHATMLNVEVLEMVHMMQSAVPVHLYIGEALTTATSFDMYSPDKVTVPDRLDPGDPLFCQTTQRALTFGGYLHSVDDENALFGLTAGQAVVPHAGFALHSRLKPRERHQKRVRSSQAAIQCLGRPLSNPAVKIVEEAIRASQLERERMQAELRRTVQEGPSMAIQKRVQQKEAEYQRLVDSITRPQEYDVGHACAAEALIRPCSSKFAPFAPPRVSTDISRLARRRARETQLRILLPAPPLALAPTKKHCGRAHAPPLLDAHAHGAQGDRQPRHDARAPGHAPARRARLDARPRPERRAAARAVPRRRR